MNEMYDFKSKIVHEEVHLCSTFILTLSSWFWLRWFKMHWKADEQDYNFSTLHLPSHFLILLRSFMFFCLSPRQCRIVTPFIRDGTYPTRNFTTLGLLWLRPLFTGLQSPAPVIPQSSGRRLPWPTGTGHASSPIHGLTTLQRNVFLENSGLN